MRGRKPDSIVTTADVMDRVPSAPGWLSKAAKAEWRRVAPIIVTDRKTLTMADMAAFANYCCAVGQASDAQAIIKREGMIAEGRSGPRKHPAVSILNDALTQARLYAAELGLTPVSRSRPSVRNDNLNDDDENPFNIV